MPRLQNVRTTLGWHPTETPDAVPALSVASGEEQPVSSPALQLQEALEQMLSRPAAQAPEPASALTLGIALLATAGVCAAFWVTLARMLISLA